MTAGTNKEEAEQLALAAPQSPVLPRRQANSQSYLCSQAFNKYCLWMKIRLPEQVRILIEFLFQ